MAISESANQTAADLLKRSPLVKRLAQRRIQPGVISLRPFQQQYASLPHWTVQRAMLLDRLQSRQGKTSGTSAATSQLVLSSPTPGDKVQQITSIVDPALLKQASSPSVNAAEPKPLPSEQAGSFRISRKAVPLPPGASASAPAIASSPTSANLIQRSPDFPTQTTGEGTQLTMAAEQSSNPPEFSSPVLPKIDEQSPISNASLAFAQSSGISSRHSEGGQPTAASFAEKQDGRMAAVVANTQPIVQASAPSKILRKTNPSANSAPSLPLSEALFSAPGSNSQVSVLPIQRLAANPSQKSDGTLEPIIAGSQPLAQASEITRVFRKTLGEGGHRPSTSLVEPSDLPGRNSAAAGSQATALSTNSAAGSFQPLPIVRELSPVSVRRKEQSLQRRSISKTALTRSLPLVSPIIQQQPSVQTIARQSSETSPEATASATPHEILSPTPAESSGVSIPSIEEITEQVNRRLSRQIAIERERRGDFEWRS